MTQRFRCWLTRLLFWRRCWWCAHSGFGTWPEKVEPEAVCHFMSHGKYVLTVAANDYCSRWEAK
jgi:hypothetical protein